MYVEPAAALGPFHIAVFGFFAFGIGILLMMEAGRAASLGAPVDRVRRSGSAGAWSCIAALAMIIAAGIWSLLS